MKGSKIVLRMDGFQKSFFLILLIFSMIIHPISATNDSINTSQSIRDGETLVSSGGVFELGFFNPGNSSNRYLGIWFKNITVKTYVWVANREVPLTTNSGVLRLTEPGILALFNHTNGSIIWSSNASQSVLNPAAQLLDSGNLVVLKDANDDRAENFAWQSFDYPSDSYFPGISLGWNYVTGVETYLSSWRSDNDPGQGEITLRLDPAGLPQLVLKRGEDVRCRIGPWNGLQFSGLPGAILPESSIYGSPIYRSLTMNENEVRVKEDMRGSSVVYRTIVSPNGVAQTWIWNRESGVWDIYTFMGADNCDRYNFCGANSLCNDGDSSNCVCLDRFEVKDRERSNGCSWRMPLKCGGDVFVAQSGIKLPDSRNSTYNNRRMSLKECEVECSRNCSCTAYTQLDISEENSGCLFYYGDLKDIRAMAQGGQTLYIRIASAELDSKGNKKATLIASLTSVLGAVFVCLSLTIFCVRRRKKERNMTKNNVPVSGHDGKVAELPFFSLSTILIATDNFSNNNKLGEGGFGPVYKGVLEDGQAIAVKRLSEKSKQGVDELKNEVILIAKLQHRNLVRTLGCCVEEEENILVYEYMPNHSLDLILFEKTKGMQLDWQKRFHIINGIAKGMLYLHQDSRLRIIHRDLKASNILLDANMNPKISDFGLARSFGGNEIEAKTKRVVGTYGYMSPEYTMDGLFSVKSDVYSFGVLVLEIVSGKRNRGFSLQDNGLNLLGYAWTLYREGMSSDLVDDSLGDSFDLPQVLRSIHVGLLCVQKRPDDRPNMSSVVLLLGNEVEPPEAKQPGFFMERDVFIAQSSSSSNAANSQNQVTITMPDGR